MTYKLRDMDLSQGRQYAYYVLPKVLISGSQFGDLEIGAKVLYSLMLNRYALSSQHSDDNTDETGRTYIVYPIESISVDLHISKPTATRLVNQLEQFGLIERKKRGQGLAALIYIKDFTQLLEKDPQQTLPTDELSEEPEEKKVYPKKPKSFTSRSKDSLPLEVKNLYPKEVADVKTADQLELPTPEVKYHTVVAQPTEYQKKIVQELSERAAAVHSGNIDPSEDNMIKITSDGRKLGLDQRCIDSLLPDEPGTKVNMCVKNILHIWEENANEKLAQLVFCDISTPTAQSTDSFVVYEDIRQKLIAAGIPKEEIAFIHEAKTEEKKKELFAKVRNGEVRILMGSTAKMGAGTNVQDRLIAMHDLDCPWRPGDVGRILRTFKIKKNVEVTDNGKIII